MNRLDFRELSLTNRRFYFILALLIGVLVISVSAFLKMESQGHVITGMNNQVVWGLPHVVAMFLIIAAAGTAHIASFGWVFNKVSYQPFGRLALVLAMSLLLGGLSVILLDLGRADRLVIALTHFNFDSVFAWNILRYLVFLVIMSLYLWSMMDRTAAAKRLLKPLSYLGFLWPIILMAGAGSIFGALTAREYYDVLTMIPLFIGTSYVLGIACFSLVLLALTKLEGRQLSDVLQGRLANCLGVAIVSVLVIELVRHLLNYYVSNNKLVELFILRDAGFVSLMFWVGQVSVGWLLPLVFLCFERFKPLRLMLVSLCAFLGGFAQLYVIIIGGQLQPLRLFPNAIMEASYNIAASYSVSSTEVLLSLGSFALALLLFTVSARVLRLTPTYSENQI